MLRIFGDGGRGCKAPGLAADSPCVRAFLTSRSVGIISHVEYEYLFMPHPWRFSAALIWLALISFHGAALAEPVPLTLANLMTKSLIDCLACMLIPPWSPSKGSAACPKRR